MTYTLTLQKIEPVTHDTNHLTFNRPDGYRFRPGQATDLALAREGWLEEKRPFTFVNLPDTDTLEFIIKSYPDHDGVTEQIAKMEPGDTALIEDPWGAIQDQGKGTFIAGGAGVTPFIAILRDRLIREGTLEGCKLIFSNKTEKDIILRQYFNAMKGLETVFTVTGQDDASVHKGRIDKAFLKTNIDPSQGHYYVCGPDKMVEEITGTLKELGVTEDRIVTEAFE